MTPPTSQVRQSVLALNHCWGSTLIDLEVAMNYGPFLGSLIKGTMYYIGVYIYI